MRRPLFILPGLLLFSLLLLAHPAQALEFIESRTIDSTQILHVRATALTPPDNITLQILEILKGDPTLRDITLRSNDFTNSPALVANHTELLLFLTKWDSEPFPRVSTPVYFQNAPPDSRSDDLRRLDLQPLNSYSEYADAVRRQLARPVTIENVPVFIPHSPESPFASSNGFRLPNDPELLEPAIRKWLQSPDPWLHALACSAMGDIAIPNRIELLKNCLNDPALTFFPARFSPWSRRDYFVRDRASAALERLHATRIPTVEYVDDRPIYQRIPYAWPLWLIPGSFVLVFVLLRLRRRPVLRSVFHAFVLASTLLAAALTVLWVRSGFTADDFFYAGHSRILSVTSHKGSVQFLHVPDFLHDQSLCHASFQPRQFGGCVRYPSDPYFWHGFGSGDGGFGGGSAQNYDCQFQPAAYVHIPDTAPHGLGLAARKAQLLIIPFRYFAPITLLPALLWLPLTILPILRRRHRRKFGLCPTCAYDLRAHRPTPTRQTQNSEPSTQNSPLPPRCPECGTPIIPAG